MLCHLIFTRVYYDDKIGLPGNGRRGRVKVISKLLMIVGLLLILIPIIGGFYTKHKQEQLYKDYIEVIQPNSSPIIQSQTIEKTPTQEKIEPVNETQNMVEMNLNQGQVIGKIKIEKIDVDLILLEGSNNHELGLGAGHLPDTAQPGRYGNCAIAGHRNYTFGSMFNRLDEVEVGDEVEVEFMGESYTYIAEEIKIVEPSDVSVLEQDKTKRLLTLITCHPVYTGTHRLIITATLKE